MEPEKKLNQEKKIREGLPHLHYKYFPWQREAIFSKHGYLFTNSGNQCGKTHAAILRTMWLCTNKNAWAHFWSSEVNPTGRPRTILYGLPSNDLIKKLYNKKLLPDYLPKGEFKDHPWFGWKLKKNPRGEVESIDFNCGDPINPVSLSFFSYGTSATNLQSVTAHAVIIDEEPPVDIFEEIIFRITSIPPSETAKEHTNGGLLSCFFTPTKAQPQFKRIMDIGGIDELYPMTDPKNHKIKVSLYDCVKFEDGSQSPFWNVPKIQALEKNLFSKRQVKMRIYGEFTRSSGLIFGSFDQINNSVKYIDRNQNRYFAGIDKGSGGAGGNTSHPSSIVVVACDNEMAQATVVYSWKSGPHQLTTSGDVIDRLEEIMQEYNLERIFYDHSTTDLRTIAERRGIHIEMANKSRIHCEGMANTLFKNGQLKIYTGDEYMTNNHDLIHELSNIYFDQRKDKRIDDLTDALLYAISSLTFKFENKLGGRRNDKMDIVKVGRQEFYRWEVEESKNWISDEHISIDDGDYFGILE